MVKPVNVVVGQVETAVSNRSGKGASKGASKTIAGLKSFEGSVVSKTGHPESGVRMEKSPNANILGKVRSSALAGQSRIAPTKLIVGTFGTESFLIDDHRTKKNGQPFDRKISPNMNALLSEVGPLPQSPESATTFFRTMQVDEFNHLVKHGSLPVNQDEGTQSLAPNWQYCVQGAMGNEKSHDFLVGFRSEVTDSQGEAMPFKALLEKEVGAMFKTFNDDRKFRQIEGEGIANADARPFHDPSAEIKSGEWGKWIQGEDDFKPSSLNGVIVDKKSGNVSIEPKVESSVGYQGRQFSGSSIGVGATGHGKVVTDALRNLMNKGDIKFEVLMINNASKYKLDP